ncbi:hypothetical protein [Dactylosporangium sp. CA-139066]|uniref:hypothetical protein n=1 Tax=Dactylosporangium sp. CA-139066 TaxID=3239930 RepID=UPI003D94F422
MSRSITPSGSRRNTWYRVLAAGAGAGSAEPTGRPSASRSGGLGTCRVSIGTTSQRPVPSS